MKTPRRSFLSFLAGLFALPKIPVEAKAENPLFASCSFSAGEPIDGPVGMDSWSFEFHDDLGILRHLSDWHNTAIADHSVDLIYSTEDLVSEITNPGFWLFPCPPRIVAEIRNRAARGYSDGDAICGWRKLPSRQSLEWIETEYALARWSRLLYLPKP